MSILIEEFMLTPAVAVCVLEEEDKQRISFNEQVSKLNEDGKLKKKILRNSHMMKQ
jgi:hypothetical protein